MKRTADGSISRTQPNQEHFTPDLKDQLKQHLNARLVYFQQSGLDITALFFNQPLPLLQLKLQSYSLLDLYLLQSRIEEVDKMLTEGLLTKYDKQRETLRHEQGRLSTISQQFRDCAVRYSRGCGVALNLASPSILTSSITNATTSTAATNSTTASSLPEIPKTTTTNSSALAVVSGSSQSHASDRLYNPFDPDGSSDMSLCSPVRDADPSHHHRLHQQPPHHRQEPSHSQIATARIELAGSTESTKQNNVSHQLPSIGQAVGLSGIGGSNASGAVSQSAADGSSLPSGGATSATEGPRRKKQKRMRDVVQGLIEENERIFTEFALLYLEQEKTYNTLLEHCKRVESDLANARVLLTSNAMGAASKPPPLSTTASSVSLMPPTTHVINNHNNLNAAAFDANSNASHLLSSLSAPVSSRDSTSASVNNSTSSRVKSSLSSKPFVLPTATSMAAHIASQSTTGSDSNAISLTIGSNNNNRKNSFAMEVEIAK